MTLPAAWTATPSGLPRARGAGLPFAGRPGAANAITDVAGVEVGYCTLIAGEGALKVGQGPVRTGVTAIFPRGRAGANRPVWAGAHSLNGNGEMTGAWWLEETGRCELAITITNTHSCGLARDASLQWAVKNKLNEQGQAQGMQDWGLPVAAETFDGHLNDINGFHVKAEQVWAALDDARAGSIEEGSVGGGTGMICYGFKGGSGTASRLVQAAGQTWSVGAFVQANFGRTPELVVAGVPVGEQLAAGFETGGGGSIIVVIATDAPLLPHQLKRLARRATLGIGRSGTIGRHSSGDIFLAFSTANEAALVESATAVIAVETLPEAEMNPLFEGAIQAIDEAILNALVANRTMVGRDGHRVPALPVAPVLEMLRKAGRI